MATPSLTSTHQSAASAVSFRAWLVPSLADWLFVVLLLWLLMFTIADTGTGLLQDSGTGFHIRAGQWVTEHGTVPFRDVFSYTKGGEPWFAWEWLSGAALFGLYQSMGMKGVIVGAAAVVALYVLVLVRHMAWRGGNTLVVLFLAHLGIGASSIHFLARPHILTLLFLAGALWMLDSDRRRQSRAVWLLVPLTALWANLHGGFAGLIICTGVLTAGTFLEGLLDGGIRQARWGSARRYGLLSGLCLLASGLNPYGFQEHLHILEYGQQGWILKMVEEFQSPAFHSTAGFYFEMLLFTGLLVAGRLLMRREIASALLVLAWAHAALLSMRHIPIFAIVMLPFAASEAMLLWKALVAGVSRKSILGTLDKMADDHAPGLRRNSVAAPVAVLALMTCSLGLAYPADFPEPRYPVSMVTRHANLLGGARVFAPDAWGDYLTFRFYPQQRVFIDGRSDFFGKELSEDYMAVLYGKKNWSRILEKYGVTVVLAPADSGVASLLRGRDEWVSVEENEDAALFRRR